MVSGRWAAGLAALLLLAGCAASAPPPAPGADADRLCTPRGESVVPLPEEAVLPPGEAQATIAALRDQGFSTAALEVADAIGLLPRLRRLPALEAALPRGGQAAEIRLLRLRQGIQDRILLALLDVTGSLATIDCEGERGDQLRVRLQAIEDRRSRRLGIASVMAGAATAALTGGLTYAGSSAANLVGIVGGSGEAALAGLQLFNEALGELRTPRNLLREVWERPAQSTLIPASVWRYLVREGESGSIADVLLGEWRTGERLGAPGSDEEQARIALLFGPGGHYTVQELEMRDAMLDLLEASIALMSRDLRVLLSELMRRPGAS